MEQYHVLIQALRSGGRSRPLGTTHTLLPTSSVLLIATLTQSGWMTLYQDGVATLLAARSPPGYRSQSSRQSSRAARRTDCMA
jgi:hypothetical protein